MPGKGADALRLQMIQTNEPPRIERLIDAAAHARPDHPALIFADRRWTYAQLRAEIDRRAARLVAEGFQPGAIIGTVEKVTDDVVIAWLACCRADLTLLYLSPRLAAPEVAQLVARSGAMALLTATGVPHPMAPSLPSLPLDLPGDADVEAHDEAVQRSRDGSVDAGAIIQTTSGSTGALPKLALLPHRLETWLCATPNWWETPDGIYYIPRPYAIAARLFCVVFGVGGTIVLSDALDTRQMETEMTAHRVTALWTVPAVVQSLTSQLHPAPPGLRLAFVRTSTAPLQNSVAHSAMERYGATVVQEYGSIEGGSLMGTPPGGAPDGSVGKPYPGVEVRIMNANGTDTPIGEVGELIVRTPAPMLRYIGDSAATDRALRDGWLWTGDLARCDDAGFYYLEGRNALRINVGGFKVLPEEVEAVLAQHPAVREAAVVGVPDAVRGEVVRAVIVPHDPPPTAGELRRFCRARLAGYKVPRRFEFRDDLPRSPLGKVLRNQL